MTVVNIYLNYDGDCEEAFNLYKSVFGGEFTHIARFKEMPVREGMPPMSAEAGEKLMHISLPISAETALMGSDASPDRAKCMVKGTNFSVSVGADSLEKAERIFNGLSAGGSVNMPLGKTFWGEYFGMLTDKFGINWMVSFNPNPKNK